ncbi:TetR/AcrR family transcriptional regulator [Endozoicomonas sp. GU-1]|uniref:TetR/AcrR family transcriptional regulator n=1 Tax=Endozoicomonas sp. GU-1 TaxID=3009078 RepID=UPI0022B33B02|nr:TetR/AcrR family transcriptional regulator [Endozoicomonas sp. GU-1]WBA80672.1 TetR/AcrR family transcriptional regulator [Endozoicomonas sp. GU-1]WBA88237.1 TetR/AcrR family transcriptional regulator [Endozoicomonas sp. GU-1]
MGRSSSFNRQQVLSDALELFWSRGFYACSLKQLEEVTDMHPGSLYYHFQNKEQLFLCALDHYLEWQLQPRIDKYLAYSPTLLDLRRFFTSGYRHGQEASYRNCCFLVTTSNELHLLPSDASERVQKGIQMLRTGFIDFIEKYTEPKKNSSVTIDHEVIASELLNLYLSIQLMAKVNPNQHALDKQVRQSLNNLFTSIPHQ